MYWLMVLEARKSNIKGLASGKGLLLHYLMAEGQREGKVGVKNSSFHKELILEMMNLDNSID